MPRDTILCPECRRNFTIPGNGDLNTSPTNFRLNSLLDALPITECKTGAVKCENCDKTRQQSAYCFTCCSFWCDDCLSFHNGIKTNKEQHVLALKDFRDEDFENILKQPPFCAKHKKKFKFFCQLCKTTICYSCAVTDHEGHAKIVLEDAAKERKLRIVRAVQFKKRKVQKKETRIATLGENCIQVQEEAARIKSDIQQFTDNLVAAIEAKKNEFFDEVGMIAKQRLELIAEERREIEEEMKRDQTAIEKSHTILKQSTSAQIMQPNDLVDELFREEGEQEDTDDLDSKHVIDFVFKRNEELFNDVHAKKLGFFRRKCNPKESTVEGKEISEGTVGLKAEIVVKTRNILGEQVYHQNNHVTMKIRNHEGHDCSTKPQIHDNEDGSYTISYFTKEWGACQASVKVNEQHVLGSPFKTELKPRLFKPVLSFGKQGSAVGMFDFLWGIAVNDKDEIAVSDRNNHHIQKFTNDGTHWKSFGTEGNQPGQFNWPTGIAFYNNYILVSDTFNHRIQIFDDQGHYLDQFGEKGKLNHQLGRPNGLAGHLLVCDSSNHRVQVFKLNGEFLTKFGAFGKEEGKFNQPISTAILSDGRIIVTEFGNHRVQIFE
ncbi:E3 ubiquitin-protein ligase TRIM71-like [Montipora foliosa]|uniref:E3 ubiquitin-protein ligase TRIM71-like n=1 Tax=Montipora foliosa TaxID=591990 RepID=UPI0035F1FBF5